MHHDSIRLEGISEGVGPKVKGLANFCFSTMSVKLKLFGGIDSTSAAMSLSELDANGLYLRFRPSLLLSVVPLVVSCASTFAVLVCGKDDSALFFAVTAAIVVPAAASCSSIYTALNALKASRATQRRTAMVQDGDAQ